MNYKAMLSRAKGLWVFAVCVVSLSAVAIDVSPATIPAGTYGTAYSATQFSATGGTGPYSFSLTGALPTGMSFSNGILFNTPTQIGSFPITVTAMDSLGATGSLAYTLVINAIPTTTTAANQTVTFATGIQTKSLTATVTSTSTISSGTVTFTVFDGATQVGSPVTSSTVSNGNASATYTVPASQAPNTYTIQAVYNPGSNLASSSDSTHTLTVNGAATTTTVGTVSSLSYKAADQTDFFSATVTSALGTVNAGSVTFSVFNGATLIGTSMTVAVSSGSAAVFYTIPGGTSTGSYTVKATYNAGGNFATSSDNTKTLTISGAATTLAAVSATSSFKTVSQSVTLTANVSSTEGTVNVGTVTFGVFNGATQVGINTTGSVANGVATATYSQPANTLPNTYTIHATFNAAGNFGTSSDNTQPLTVTTAPTVVTVANKTANYSSVDQPNTTLTATVTGGGSTIGSGTITFSVFNAQSQPVGTSVTSGTVSAGSASANYNLLAGTPLGVYTIQATYNPSANYAGSTDSAHMLTVNGTATTTTGAAKSVSYTAADQSVNLTATVKTTLNSINLEEGFVTFSIYSGSTLIGTPVTSNQVTGGAALATYTLPGGTPAGAYTIHCDYGASGNYGASSDYTRVLTVTGATSTTTVTPTSATFSNVDQNVTLNASVTSAQGSVDAGTVTFSVFRGATQIGSNFTSATVSGGQASVSYVLPANTSIGTLTIHASYNSAGTNFAASSDNAKTLALNGAVTVTAATSTGVTYRGTVQSVTLMATVTSNAGTVTAGTVTFKLFNGATQVGATVTSNPLTNGTTSVSYSIPGGTGAGTLQIQATYNAGGNFATSSDNTATVTISAAGTTTSSTNFTAVFKRADQTVGFSANLSSVSSGVVMGGSITFTVSSSGNQIGIPVTGDVPVAGGGATANFTLPSDTPAGVYTIQIDYSGSANFSGSSTTSTLTVNTATTQTAVNNTTASYSANDQPIAISGTVTSASGSVDSGTVTFTLSTASSGGTTVGTPVTSNVTGGAVSATYTLPGGTPVGLLFIQAVYNPNSNLKTSNSSAQLQVTTTATTTIAPTFTAHYHTAAQTIQLLANVSSQQGQVNAGTVTFALYNSTGNPIGTATTSGVLTSGTATVNYGLPAATPLGTLTMIATYNPGGNFATSSDGGHTVIVAGAITTPSGPDKSVTYKGSAQTVSLNATVTCSDVTPNTINVGTITFSIFNGATQIGNSVTSTTVVNNNASATYTVPAGTPGGMYTLKIVYSGGGLFDTGTDTTHTLTVNPATSATVASNATGGFGSIDQNVTLNATVTSPNGTVNGGTVTFGIFQAATQIGVATTSGAVTNGQASATWVLPAGTSIGQYSIHAMYSGSGNFLSSVDNSKTLNITTAPTVTTVASTSAIFSSAAQTVPLSASVTSGGGIVDAGTVTFSVFNGATQIGASVTSNAITSGAASSNFSLPGGILPAVLTINATYNAAGNFAGSSDAAHTLTVDPAACTLAVTSATAPFSFNARNVAISATVTSAAGTVNDGSIDFVLLDGGTPVGVMATSGTVTNGTATANYSVPGNTPIGTLTIQGTYNSGGTFSSSFDSAHTLTITNAPTTTVVQAAAAEVNANSQSGIL